jgi:hypothetical protein
MSIRVITHPRAQHASATASKNAKWTFLRAGSGAGVEQFGGDAELASPFSSG